MLHRTRRTRRITLVTALLLAVTATFGVATPVPVAALQQSQSTGVVAQRGDFSLLVARIQQILLAAGISVPGGVDGAYGRATERAVAQFQARRHLPQTGTVDTATAVVMGLAAPTPLLAPGSRGTAVSTLQQRLINLGITVRGGADGKYGAATATAVRAFQRAQGLPATGSVDEGTAAILANLAGGVPSSPSPSGTATGAALSTFPLPATCRFWDTWGAARSGGRRHEGVDIFAPSGTPIYAVRTGRISKQQITFKGSLAGNALWLTTANGTYYFYAHLKAFANGIRPGSSVKAGDLIGYVGMTGNAPVPHLHFEVHPGGGPPVDPYPYAKAVSNC